MLYMIVWHCCLILKEGKRDSTNIYFQKIYITCVSCKKKVHSPGLEPGSPAWEAGMLPLYHECCTSESGYRCTIYITNNPQKPLLREYYAILLSIHSQFQKRKSAPSVQQAGKRAIIADSISEDTGIIKLFNYIYKCSSTAPFSKLLLWVDLFFFPPSVLLRSSSNALNFCP